MGPRRCPLCKVSAVPVFRFCCPRCYRKMPRPMRHLAVQAWQLRLSEPVPYAEAMATVLLWYRDHRVGRRE